MSNQGSFHIPNSRPIARQYEPPQSSHQPTLGSAIIARGDANQVFLSPSYLHVGDSRRGFFGKYHLIVLRERRAVVTTIRRLDSNSPLFTGTAPTRGMAEWEVQQLIRDEWKRGKQGIANYNGDAHASQEF